MLLATFLTVPSVRSITRYEVTTEAPSF